MSEVSSHLILTSFVPRQVMLETATNAAAASNDGKYKEKKRRHENVAVMEVEGEGKKSKKKKSSKISNAVEDGSGSVELLAFDKQSGDDISRKGKEREELLRSIAAFLEGCGFAKTLSVFRKEAQIEVNSRGVSCMNLEELFDKYIESSKRYPVASIEGSKEKDAETKDKRRKIKQVSDSFAKENTEKNHWDATLGSEENTDSGKLLSVKKEKKHKAIIGKNMGEVVCLEEIVVEKIEELKDLTINPNVETGNFEKDKGVKKKKEAKQFLEQFELGDNQKVIVKKPNDEGAYASTKLQESVNVNNLVNDLSGNVDESRKDKKKNKKKKLEKSTSDSLHTINSEKLVEETSDIQGKHDNDGLQKFDLRKDSIAISKEDTTDVETTTNKTTNKKRKRPSSNETAIQVENIAAASKSKHTKPEVAIEEKETWDHKVLTCSESSPCNWESKEPSEALCSVVLDKHKGNPTLQDPKKQLSGHELTNGSIGKHQNERSIKPKSMKNDKHSSEPKVVNAFQRVKVEEVQYADERMQDNSYWALDDSGSGYGAKAQEVLGQVRGRDFRHEKTKKKRGTYRGGQIDLQSHSIKFNYSDEE
ncbi:hypothetical protein IEQ34_001496 [Dendrobium chrysotoxum]|uniref:LisH domain-containing protein n=1 Tax=Dendrobium chrysotoxum TaxID=161865 RepID=A0AAV7HQZ3_DENCH|nr:hypothetical protein IEQ34_001496 [Dendrobium chrysotoxum]